VRDWAMRYCVDGGMWYDANKRYWRRRDADARLEGTVVSTGAVLLC
jgi:hypothetical protein